ncbi:MAG: hypothetical protein E7487_06240 [Ruminococcaceae bacterium]|nr:hypothetical protein [Oscillospiraceae bacterium]
MPIRVGLKTIKLWNESLEQQVCNYESEKREKGQIVFYGPSYFTRWKASYGETPMEEMIVGKSGTPCVINRGFGSSCSEHQLYYYPRMVRPLEPSVLVYECFGNGTYHGYSYEEIWELAQRVIAYARVDFPDIHIYLLSPLPELKDTPEDIRKKMEFGLMLQQYTEVTPNCYYIDALHNTDFKRKDIFIADGVHLNKLGYQFFAKMFRNALAKELERF